MSRLTIISHCLKNGEDRRRILYRKNPSAVSNKTHRSAFAPQISQMLNQTTLSVLPNFDEQQKTYRRFDGAVRRLRTQALSKSGFYIRHASPATTWTAQDIRSVALEVSRRRSCGDRKSGAKFFSARKFQQIIVQDNRAIGV